MRDLLKQAKARLRSTSIYIGRAAEIGPETRTELSRAPTVLLCAGVHSISQIFFPRVKRSNKNRENRTLIIEPMNSLAYPEKKASGTHTQAINLINLNT